jgi:hypothetical protein
MGYHHCHVPNMKQIQRELESLGLEEFIRIYSKYECLIGDSDVIEFIEQKAIELENKKSN